MLKPLARSHFLAIEKRLEACRRGLPARAERFGQRVDRLEQKLKGQKARWLWVSDGAVESLDTQLALLQILAPELVRLAAAAEQLGRRIRQCADAADSLRAVDPELGAWSAERCATWRVEVERVGTRVDRQPLLDADNEALLGIERALNWHEEALARWGHAQRILALLDTLDAAELTAELSQLRANLIADGADRSWLAAVEKLLEGHPDAQAPPPIVPGLDPNEKADEARRWSKALEEEEDAVNDLDHRLLEAGQPGPREPPSEAREELYREAEALLNRLIARASTIRGAKHESLRRQIENLTRAAEPFEELDELLEGLDASIAAQRVYEHVDWMEAWQRATDRFRYTAQTRSSDLEARLRALGLRLREGLETLRQEPVSPSLEDRADDLSREIQALSRADGIDEVLEGLNRGEELEARLVSLQTEAERDLRDLDHRRQALKEKNALLQAGAQHAGFRVASLDRKIGRLKTAGREQSLEDVRAAMAAVDRELDRLVAGFLDDCRGRVDERVAEVGRINRELNRLGADEELSPDLDVAADTGPENAGRVAARAQAVLDRARGRVEDALRDLKAFREEALSELGRVPSKLRRNLREEREALKAELAREESVREEETIEPDDLKRLIELRELRERSEDFLDRVLGPERTIRKLGRDLKKRLARLDRNHPGRLPNELVDRVAALVYGVGDSISEDAQRDMSLQLGRAEELLARLELHAARLEAREIAALVDELREGVGRSGSARFREAASELLEEIDGHGHERPLPADLRTRLIRANARSGAEVRR